MTFLVRTNDVRVLVFIYANTSSYSPALDVPIFQSDDTSYHAFTTM